MISYNLAADDIEVIVRVQSDGGAPELLGRRSKTAGESGLGCAFAADRLAEVVKALVEAGMVEEEEADRDGDVETTTKAAE